MAADPYAGAQDDIEKQKRMLLEAVAQQGTVGADSVRRQQQQLAQERDRLLQQAMLNSTALGHSQEQDQLNGQRLAQLYNDRASQLDAQYQEAQRSAAHRSQAVQDYLNEAQAAIPVAREYTRRKLAADAAKRSASGEDSTLSILSKQLGGISNANKYLLSQADAYGDESLSHIDESAIKNQMRNAGLTREQAIAKLRGVADKDVESGLGLPSGYITAIRPPAKKSTASNKFARAAGISDDRAAHIRSGQMYKKILSAFAQDLGAVDDRGKPLYSKAALRSKGISAFGTGPHADTIRLVLAELGI